MGKSKSTAAIVPRKAPKQERSRNTYQVILNGATAIIRREGIRKLSTNRVAEESGVSIGSLYQYFPSKAAIIAALIDQTLEREFEGVKNALAELSANAGPREAATAVLYQYYRLNEEEWYLRQALVAAVPTVEKSTTTLKFHGDTAELMLAYFRDHFALTSTEPEISSFIVQYLLKGVILSSVDERVLKMDRRKLAAEMAEILMNILRIPETQRGPRS